LKVGMSEGSLHTHRNGASPRAWDFGKNPPSLVSVDALLFR